MSTPNLLLKINNTALTEAIRYCDFALSYNTENYIVSDGFIDKQTTPELGNYYPCETLNFILENQNTSRNELSYLKKITIRNVTNSNLLNSSSDEDNILTTIFGDTPSEGWQYKIDNDGKQILVCEYETCECKSSSEIEINPNVNFDYLNHTNDYYLSYTVQYTYQIENQEKVNNCVFDPLIKITNGSRNQ